MATLREIFTLAIQEVNLRYRLDNIDNLLAGPTDNEQEVAVMDALAEVNSFPPETQYAIDWVFGENGDPRVRNLVYLATARNVIRMLVSHWTSEGFSLSLEEFNVEDRLPRYEALMNTLTQQFEDQVLQYKTATQKFSKLAYAGNNNPLIPFRYRMYTGRAKRW